MKLLIGFFLGLLIASAVAEVKTVPSTATNSIYIGTMEATLNAGTTRDHKPSPIFVDADGYVICSTETK